MASAKQERTEGGKKELKEVEDALLKLKKNHPKYELPEHIRQLTPSEDAKVIKYYGRVRPLSYRIQLKVLHIKQSIFRIILTSRNPQFGLTTRCNIVRL